MATRTKTTIRMVDVDVNCGVCDDDDDYDDDDDDYDDDYNDHDDSAQILAKAPRFL